MEYVHGRKSFGISVVPHGGVHVCICMFCTNVCPVQRILSTLAYNYFRQRRCARVYFFVCANMCVVQRIPSTLTYAAGTRVNHLELCTVGRLQPTAVRQKPRPEVQFDKGGSDFRCPRTFTCLGKQCLSRDVYRTAGRPAFTQQDRWYVPGDKFKGKTEWVGRRIE